MPTMTIRFTRLVPKAAMKTRPNRIWGIAIATSASRIRISSNSGRPRPAAKPQTMPMHHAQGRRAEHGAERHPTAVQHAGEQVPAELVGAEPVARARRAEGVGRVDRVRPVRREQRRGDDGQDDEGQNRPRDHGSRVPRQGKTTAATDRRRGPDRGVGHVAALATSRCRGSRAANRTSTTSEVRMNVALTRITTLCRTL